MVTFNVGDARFAVVRQSGLPVHEIALSRQRFAPGAILEAKKLVAELKPDVIHAWGSTAQIVAALLAGGSKKGSTPVVWSVTRTSPLMKSDGWIDHKKLGLNKSRAARCQRIVYSSAVAAANFKRAGFPEDNGVVIAPGVDADRFKPDDAARARVRQQLELPMDAVVVGMYAPVVPESDHGTFMKAIGELVRINSNLYCVLAGKAVVKGNSALSGMVGGGVLGTRTRLVGEWTDLSSLFNACDVVCSTASHDQMRLTLAASMLCGTMCVGTGMGSQGEVIGSFGVSVEPGSPDATARGIRRILEMPVDRKAFMAQAARKHILQNFNMTRSIEKYHELYVELVTGEAAAAPAKAAAAADANDPAAQILISRAQATSKNLAKPPPKQEATEAAPPPQSLEFGSVQASATPIAAVGVEEKQAPAPAPQNDYKSDTIDFSVLTTRQPAFKVKPEPAVEAAAAKPAEPVKDIWTDDDAKLMDEILVEADEETAKRNAQKAEAAAKAAAAKAAANAALTAALAAGGDAAKGINPKLVAAALSANAGARPVAGKPPPAPAAAALKK